MTFLEICQTVARESGTVPGDGQPASVVNQTGRLGDITRWVRQGWVDIQNWHTTWRWMTAEFDAEIASGVFRVTADDLGADRFADWLHEDGYGIPTTSAYRVAVGASDDAPLTYVPWAHFYTSHIRGTQDGRPGFYSVDSQRRIVLAPMPDEPYRMRGLFRRAPQMLLDNDDTPEIPAQFHMLIVAEALGYLFARDEAMMLLQAWGLRGRRLRADLERDQLPAVEMLAEPLG